MTGNLCRCMAYVRIRKAIKLAAAELRKERRQWLSSSIDGLDARVLSRRGFLIGMAGAGACFGFARRQKR